MTKHESTSRMSALRVCTVRIVSKTGAVYSFPDFSRGEIFKVLSGQVLMGKDLTLTNVSSACLVVPFRIIETIRIVDDTDSTDGEIVWKAPST